MLNLILRNLRNTCAVFAFSVLQYRCKEEGTDNDSSVRSRLMGQVIRCEHLHFSFPLSISCSGFRGRVPGMKVCTFIRFACSARSQVHSHRLGFSSSSPWANNRQEQVQVCALDYDQVSAGTVQYELAVISYAQARAVQSEQLLS